MDKFQKLRKQLLSGPSQNIKIKNGKVINYNQLSIKAKRWLKDS